MIVKYAFFIGVIILIICLIWFFLTKDKLEVFFSKKMSSIAFLGVIFTAVGLVFATYSVIQNNDLVVKLVEPIKPNDTSIVNIEPKFIGDTLIIDGYINPIYKSQYKVYYESGEYNIFENRAINVDLDVLVKNLNEVLDKNKNKNLRVIVETFGQSDRTRSLGGKYTGDLGDLINVKFFSQNEGIYKNRTLLANKSRIWNEDYALLRAVGLQKFFQEKFKFINTEFALTTNISQKLGNSERLSILKIKIVNAKYIGIDNPDFIDVKLTDYMLSK